MLETRIGTFNCTLVDSECRRGKKKSHVRQRIILYKLRWHSCWPKKVAFSLVETAHSLLDLARQLSYNHRLCTGCAATIVEMKKKKTEKKWNLCDQFKRVTSHIPHVNRSQTMNLHTIKHNKCLVFFLGMAFFIRFYFGFEQSNSTNKNVKIRTFVQIYFEVEQRVTLNTL